MPGLLRHSAAIVIKYLLIDAELGTAALSDADWPIFIGNEPSAPDNIITIYSRGLTNQGKSLRDGEVAELYGIDLRLRSSDYSFGDNKILAIKDYLDKVAGKEVRIPQITTGSVTIPPTTYRVSNFSRRGSSRGNQGFLHLGKARQQNAPGDIVSTSQREMFGFSGRVNLRMVS